MAKLRLTLHGISCYDFTTQKDIPNDLSVSTEKDTAEANIYIDESTGAKRYSLNLIDFSFKKQMYKPTEIIADIQLTITEGSSWFSLDRSIVNKIFKRKKVTLEEVKYNASTKSDEVLQTLGSDFYVHEVIPRYKPNAMFATLKIYSPDKVLDIYVGSRTFVSKKLKDNILKNEMENYKNPSDSSKIDWNADDMKIIAYETKPKQDSNQKDIPYQFDIVHEHIFPYLVQYNETFYKLLARTCNRWGEFMYYENSKLNFGYNADDTSPLVIGDNDYKDLYFVDNDTTEGTYSTLGQYDYPIEEPDYNSYEIKKDPKGIKANPLGLTAKDLDKYVMKKFASFFKNSKSIPTFLANSAFDDAYDLAKQLAKIVPKNKKSNSKNFDKKPGQDEQYNSNKDLYNVFTEVDTKFNTEYYLQILGREMESEHNAICIDFDTTCPKVKLGGYISLNNTTYIVTEISSSVREDYKFKIDMSNGTVAKIPVRALVFKLTATPKDTKGITGVNYYPTVIPAGHFRMAETQVATISDNGDPCDAGRLRIAYPWDQYIDKKDNNKVKAVEKSSPWIHIASHNSGKKASRYYIGDKVLVDYVNGNVERPYISGVVAAQSDDTDIFTTTPGGHLFKMEDDPTGLMHFMGNMFLPAFGTLETLIPPLKTAKISEGAESSVRLGGGFELSDYYGIYKISGSSDWRSINIDSPWGKIFMNAFTGISISAPNGDIEIKGKNISIEAGNNLTLTSGTNAKYKILGDNASDAFGDVAAAVAKKLADLMLNIVDLSTLRAAIEVVFRPAEGALRIKSNRYLMLESGKGSCEYPLTAYKDAATLEKLRKKQIKESSGLDSVQLGSGIVSMIAKINEMGDSISKKYRETYNQCVIACSYFNNAFTIVSNHKWHNEYKAGQPLPKICKSYSELKDKFWGDQTEFTENDLEFSDDFALDETKVKDTTISRLYPGLTDAAKIKEKKELVVKNRKAVRLQFLVMANFLLKRIKAFKDSTKLTKEDIESIAKTIPDKTVKSVVRSSLATAFDTSKWLPDTFYLTISDEEKLLSKDYKINDLKDHAKVLKRQAAVLYLEAVGFKDEWRQTDEAETLQLGGVPVPGIPKNKKLKVEKPKTIADFGDDAKWENYVNTIQAFAPLSEDHNKFSKEWIKKAQSLKKSLSFWESFTENNSWNLKSGQILFSSGDNIYHLDKNIGEVQAPAKRPISESDQENAEVTTYLSSIRGKLKDIK